MKSTGRYMFYVILLLVPLVYGYLVNTMKIPLYPFVMQVVFLVFWFYVGYLFSKWETPAWKSFLVGNSIMVIVFHFVYMAICFSSDASRSMDLAALSQHYMLAFVYGAARLLPFVTSGTFIMFSAYVMMLAVFSLGYFMNKRKHFAK